MARDREEKRTYTITGTITARTTGRTAIRQGNALKGLTVRAYRHATGGQAASLGESAVIDAEGRYSISFPGKDLEVKGAGSDKPEVFIRVYEGDELLGESPTRGLAGEHITIDLQVASITISVKEPERWVHGEVRDAEGGVLKGIKVEAFDRDLRSEETLGQDTSDKGGRYRIAYFARQFRNHEKAGADLVVRALAEDDSLLAESSIVFNAPREAEVNLTIAADKLQPPTLFERISQALAPLLGDLNVEDLEEDKEHQDLGFLAGETGFGADALARFALAYRLAELGIEPEFWFALLGGALFEYSGTHSLKEQQNALVETFPMLDATAVRKALVRSFNQREIPSAHRQRQGKWVDAFLALIARQILTGGGRPTFVKSALEDAGIRSAKKQVRFARLFGEHKAITPELLDTMERERLFKQSEIADLRTSFELAELTQGDFPVVKMIKEKFGVRRLEQIRELAKKSEEEWVDLVTEMHAAGGVELPLQVRSIAGLAEGALPLPGPEMYGHLLERQFREAFPTAAYAGRLERALANGGAHGLRNAEVLKTFLDRHESFELLSTPVDDFLEGRLHPELRRLAQDEPFRLELKAVQRVFKLAPTFEATDALLADGLHSAQQIYRMGESEFVRRYAGVAGFTEESARLAWNRAADTHAAVVTVVADLKAFEVDALPRVLQSGSAALSLLPQLGQPLQRRRPLRMRGLPLGAQPRRIFR